MPTPIAPRSPARTSNTRSPARAPSHEAAPTGLAEAAAKVKWDKPSPTSLTALAHAIADAFTQTGPEHTQVRKLAANLRLQIEQLEGKPLGNKEFSLAYVAMGIASNNYLAAEMSSFAAASRTSSTPTAVRRGAAGAPAPQPPPAARKTTTAPAHKNAAQRAAERLATRAARTSATARARAATARPAAEAPHPPHGAAGAGAGDTPATGAGPSAAPAPAIVPESDGAGPGVTQRLATHFAVGRASREGRRAEAALPEVTRKLSKRGNEVERLQAGIGQGPAAGDAEAEYAALLRELGA